MYSISYVEKNLSSHLKRRWHFFLVNVLGGLVLLPVIFVLGPLFHESVQMILLGVYRCHYMFAPYFEWSTGVHAYVMPFCPLSVVQEVLLYTVGIAFNLLVSVAFFVFSWILLRDGKFFHSNFCLYLGLGFSFNPIVYFFSDAGNLINLLKVVGIGRFAYILPVLGSVLFALEVVYTYVMVAYYKEEYDSINRRILMVKGFMSEINYRE